MRQSINSYRIRYEIFSAIRGLDIIASNYNASSLEQMMVFEDSQFIQL